MHIDIGICPYYESTVVQYIQDDTIEFIPDFCQLTIQAKKMGKALDKFAWLHNVECIRI